MTISIQIKGIEEAQQFLKKAGKETFDNANKAIVKAGFYVEGEVKESIAGHRAEHVSVDTGRFLNSVKAEQKQVLTATISTNVPYAQFLEYGTSRFRPRRHFTNSAKRNEKKVRDFVEQEIKKVG
jgi:HK97 gp10 family phage protein